MYCILSSHGHEDRGLPEAEQWLFSRLQLDNLLLQREVVEMTGMAAEPLVRRFRLWRSGSHCAAHPHSGTSYRTADTRVPWYL